jgi:hypothetical protein
MIPHAASDSAKVCIAIGVAMAEALVRSAMLQSSASGCEFAQSGRRLA